MLVVLFFVQDYRVSSVFRYRYHLEQMQKVRILTAPLFSGTFQLPPLTPTHKPPPCIMHTPHRLEIRYIPRHIFHHIQLRGNSLVPAGMPLRVIVLGDAQLASGVPDHVRVREGSGAGLFGRDDGGAVWVEGVDVGGYLVVFVWKGDVVGSGDQLKQGGCKNQCSSLGIA